MNIQFKQDIARACFVIYKNGDDLKLIVKLIEDLLKEYNIEYLTKNLTCNVIGTASDRLEAALDEKEIRHEQHMRAILERHFNFIRAFIIRNAQAA